MTRDPRQPTTSESLDDDAIGHLVRDAAAGWTMPPVRLDAPSWRERVRSPRERRVAGARGWFGRLGRASTAAVALTVAGALVAVVLTRPPIEPGKSPATSANASAGPSGAAQASALPKLMLSGDLPDPAQLLVQTEQGDAVRVDLADGSIGQPILNGRFHLLGDGSIVCLCISESGNVNGRPTVDTVRLERYTADGTLTASAPVETFTGSPDPRDALATDSLYPWHVGAIAAYSADGRYGYVGWVRRAAPVWKSGVLLVDLADGSVLGRLELPDATTGEGDARRIVGAPEVVGDDGSGQLVLAQAFDEWSSPNLETASSVSGADAFRVSISDGRWSGLSPIGSVGASCDGRIDAAGLLENGGAWLACRWPRASATYVQRLDSAGDLVGTQILIGSDDGNGGLTTLSADRSVLYGWDPTSATLTKIDLATGEKTVGEPATARVDEGPLTAFGHWLAPIVAAKSFLTGAVVASADGKWIYALGVARTAGQSEVSGSSGVYVFDATTLASVGHWEPTADFVSLAVSRDDRFLYAAGLPDVDADGEHQLSQGASITVYSTVDGTVRLVAGQLGGGMLTFPSPTLN